MKKITISLFLVISLMIPCCACGNNSAKAIIGYWMRGDGYTISFVDESSCSFGEGALRGYKIYDGNHLQVVESSSSGVIEFVFEVEGDTLKIRKATEEGYTYFTKNEGEQKDILEEERKRESIALEEQILWEQIDNLKTQIVAYQKEIATIQSDIEWNNNAIENNKQDIIRWEEAIAQKHIDCEDAVKFGDDREYQEKQRDSFIATHNESIQDCNKRIAELEEKNVSLQEDINLIAVEIEKLEKEIDAIETKLQE